MYIYIDIKETTSNNTKAFVHILVNVFSCVLTRESLENLNLKF